MFHYDIYAELDGCFFVPLDTKNISFEAGEPIAIAYVVRPIMNVSFSIVAPEDCVISLYDYDVPVKTDEPRYNSMRVTMTESTATGTFRYIHSIEMFFSEISKFLEDAERRISNVPKSGFFGFGSGAQHKLKEEIQKELDEKLELLHEIHSNAV